MMDWVSASLDAGITARIIVRVLFRYEFTSLLIKALSPPRVTGKSFPLRIVSRGVQQNRGVYAHGIGTVSEYYLSCELGAESIVPGEWDSRDPFQDRDFARRLVPAHYELR